MPRHAHISSFSRARRALCRLLPLNPAAGLGLALLGLTFLPVAAQDLPTPAAAASAAAAPGLTLRAALAQALALSPELAVARREFEATEGAVLQGAARPNPELSWLVEDTRAATRTTTVQLTQPIEWGGQRAARIGAAQRGRDIAAAQWAAARTDLRATVVVAFHEVLLAQAQFQLAGDAAELARRGTDAATKRVAAGKISPVEETRARVAEASVRLEAAQAGADLRLARQRLAATWGDATPRFDRVEATGAGAGAVASAGDGAADALVVPTLDALALRLAASPSLRRARLELQRRAALSDLERARQTPDLTVSLGVKRDAQLGRQQAVIGVSMPLPLFDRNHGNVLEALRREDKARDELAVAENQLKTALMQAWGRLDSVVALVNTLRDDVLPGARSAYAAASRGFELGKFSLLDVLDAQRTLFQAQAQQLRARGDAQRARVDIDRLLGDGDDAMSPTNPGDAALAAGRWPLTSHVQGIRHEIHVIKTQGAVQAGFASRHRAARRRRARRVHPHPHDAAGGC